MKGSSYTLRFFVVVIIRICSNNIGVNTLVMFSINIYCFMPTPAVPHHCVIKANKFGKDGASKRIIMIILCMHEL